MSGVNLLSCPCCGSDGIDQSHSDAPVYCMNCGLRGNNRIAWNTRLAHQPDTARPLREDAAAIIHGAMVWATRQGGEPDVWQNGNSFAEDKARDTFAALFHSAPQEGWQDIASALLQYEGHQVYCGHGRDMGKPCVCGYIAAQDALRRLIPTPPTARSDGQPPVQVDGGE